MICEGRRRVNVHPHARGTSFERRTKGKTVPPIPVPEYMIPDATSRGLEEQQMMSATILEGRRASKEHTSSPLLKPFEEKNRCGEVGKDRNGVEDSEAHEQVPRLKEGANCQTQDALVSQ